MPALEIVWHDDINSYVGALESAPSFRLPLLRPSQASRGREWVRIIKATCHARPGVPHRTRLRALGEVYCLTKELSAIARAYASRTARSFYEGTPTHQGKGNTPVVIFGERFEFYANRFHSVDLLKRPNTALMTAADPPGLTFLIAKTLTGPAPNPTGRVGLIDAIGAQTICSSGIGTQPLRLSTFLDHCRPALDRLVIHGHGDGAHLRLPERHLCGRLSSREAGLDGSALNEACFEADGAVGCRKCPQSRDALSPSHLRCDELILLTCNGLSVAGEIHPSTSSLALSSVEGYARVVVAPWASIETSSGNALACFEACRGAISVGDLRELLNDRVQATLPLRPYHIIGDPWVQSVLPELSAIQFGRIGAPVSARPAPRSTSRRIP